MFYSSNVQFHSIQKNSAPPIISTRNINMYGKYGANRHAEDDAYCARIYVTVMIISSIVDGCLTSSF